MGSTIFSYKKWNEGGDCGFYIKSLVYAFNNKEENDCWTLREWLFE